MYQPPQPLLPDCVESAGPNHAETESVEQVEPASVRLLSRGDHRTLHLYRGVPHLLAIPQDLPHTKPQLPLLILSEAAALWCSTRPEAVLASFAELHEANSTGDISDYWTIAGMVLQQFDYDVAAWRQLDTFEVGFWTWRASCQVAYDSR